MSMNDKDGALAVIVISQWVTLAPGSDPLADVVGVDLRGPASPLYSAIYSVAK
jgi:hypothetical protein